MPERPLELELLEELEVRLLPELFPERPLPELELGRLTLLLPLELGRPELDEELELLLPLGRTLLDEELELLLLGRAELDEEPLLLPLGRTVADEELELELEFELELPLVLFGRTVALLLEELLPLLLPLALLVLMLPGVPVTCG